MDYILHIATLLMIYMVLVHSMNIYLGYTGILALSHIAFFGIGGYIGALISLHYGSFWLGFLLAGGAALIIGVLLGLTSVRLRADYLGIATLGFAQIASTLFQTSEITRGSLGLPGIPRPSIFGLQLTGKLEFFLFTAIISAILVYLMYRMVKSPFGRILETIRDDEVAAKSLGKNTVFYKLAVFSLGSMIAALIGVIYAHFITYISPMSFHINELSLVLVMTMLGGLGTFRGPFIGATLLILFQESVKFLKDIEFLHIEAQHIGAIQMISFSLIFLIVMIYFPQGVGGYWKHKKRRRKQFTSY